MSVEIVAGLIGSQFMRALASDVATTLACQAIKHAVSTMTRPSTSGSVTVRPDIQVTRTDARAAVREPARPELRALPNVEVVSSIPGRLRLRIRGMRGNAARAAEVAVAAQALDGVTAAEANPLTGTLLARFDAHRTAVTEIVAALEPPLPTRPLRAAERAPYLRLVVG